MAYEEELDDDAGHGDDQPHLGGEQRGGDAGGDAAALREQAHVAQRAEGLDHAGDGAKQAQQRGDRHDRGDDRRMLLELAVELPEGETPDLTSEVPAPEKPPIKLPATVKADGGIYFDAEAGLLTFLKNVSFDHPQFSLQGADEVKVFVDKKKSAKAPAGQEKDKQDGDLEFGDPTKIIATGAVVVERKTSPTDPRSVKASGRQMVYDLVTGELIIRGGQPWVLSDSANGRILDPNGYIRINLKSGDASFVGRSQAFVETDRPR